MLAFGFQRPRCGKWFAKTLCSRLYDAVEQPVAALNRGAREAPLTVVLPSHSLASHVTPMGLSMRSQWKSQSWTERRKSCVRHGNTTSCPVVAKSQVFWD